jgi:DNA polymerase-3 subunit gamma/tau
MSEFVVSARKYRPVRFDEVVGQGHVSETLKNALRQNRLAHAFLFCGPRGVGKTTNARILAKVLNCLNVSDDFEPCNTCDNCVAFNQNASFNIFELDGASNNKVDHMHQLMEQVRIPPQSGRKKVYIIDEVHMLSASAFNAFLKTLEEPPEYAVFILATTEKHKILPTILSRCQVYDFHRIRPADMVLHLEGICKEEGLTAETEALHLVAEKADGALRDALSIFDRLVSSSPDNTLSYKHAAEQLNVLDHSTFFQVVDALLREDAASLYLQFDQVLSNGFEPQPFLGGLAKHLRQLFVCKSPQTLKLIEVSDSLRQRYAEQAALCGMSFLVNALNLAAECDFRLRQAVNKRLHVELYLVKMAFAGRTISRDTIATPSDQVAPLAVAPAQKKSEAQSTPEVTQPAATPEPTASPLPSAASVPSATPVPAAPTVLRTTSSQEKEKAPTPTGYVVDPAPLEKETVKEPSAPAKEVEAAVAVPTTTPAPSAAEVSRLKKNAPPKISALPSISFDEDEEDDDVEFVKPETLTLSQLQGIWDKAAAKQKDSVKSMMRNTKLDYKCPLLRVLVGSKYALNALRNDATDIRDIKSELNCPDLNIVIEFDPEMAPKEAPKKEIIGPAEQYQTLIDLNPAIDVLRRRMNLELDE